MKKQKTNSSQFGLTSGIRQDHTEFIGCSEERRGSRNREKLWVFTELASPSGGGTAAARAVVETIQNEYFRNASQSITSALETSVRAANRLLHDYNSGAPAHKQAFIGVSCVVVRDEEIFLAQVEPTCAIVIHRGEPQALPTGVPRAEVDLTPLGLDPEIEVELHSSPFDAGDTVSLITTGLTKTILVAEDEYGLSYQDHSGAVEYLYHLAARSNLMDEHALVIENPPRRSAESSRVSFQELGREWLQKAGQGMRSYAQGYASRSRSENDSGGERRHARFFKTHKEDEDAGEGGGSKAWRIPTAQMKRHHKLGIVTAILGIILLLGIAGTLGARAYEGYQEQQRLESLISSAEQQRKAAHGKPGPAALQHLQTARDYLAEARKIDPERPSINTIDHRIDSDWDTVNNVERMVDLKRLATLRDYQRGSAARLVILKNTAYLLSRPSGILQSYDLRKGSVHKLNPAGVRFTGFSWNNTGLLALSDTGRVFTYAFSEHKWSSVKLGGKLNWSYTTGFDSYGTKIYISFRDTTGVYRYDLQSPQKWRVLKSNVKGQPLLPASISVNGNLWAIDSQDNSVWRFVNGKVNRRLWVEAQPAIQGAYGLVALDTNKSLYMLDSQQNRVMRFTSRGQLQAQYMLPRNTPQSRHIDAAFADEKGRKLYLIVDNTLYTYPLLSSGAKG